MIALLGHFLFCCAATIFLEALPVFFLREKRRWWKAGLICNLITNPPLNALYLLLCLWLKNTAVLTAILLVMEVAVVWMEAWMYQRMLDKPRKTCFLFSLAANAFSFGLGTLFSQIT